MVRLISARKATRNEQQAYYRRRKAWKRNMIFLTPNRADFIGHWANWISPCGLTRTWRKSFWKRPAESDAVRMKLSTNYCGKWSKREIMIWWSMNIEQQLWDCISICVFGKDLLTISRMIEIGLSRKLSCGFSI